MLSDKSVILPTCEELTQEPHRLLHSANPSKPAGPFDGIVGNVILDGNFIIASPNVNYIYAPPVGDERPVFLRADGFYADDDPVQWPQPYEPRHPHQAAIPRGPRPEGNDGVMWWPMAEFNIALLPHPSHSFHLGSSDLECVKAAACPLLARADEYRISAGAAHPQIAQTLSNCLSNFLVRLQTLPMPRHEVTRCIAEVKRFYRELTGVLDYMLVYKPRIDGPPTTPPYPVANTMGAFTYDPLVAQNFLKAGLPVWFVRPRRDFSYIRIDAIAPIVPPTALEFAECSPRFATIFKGKASDYRRTEAIRNQSTLVLHTVDAFSWGESAPRPDEPSSSTSPALRISGHPYRSKKLDPHQRAGMINRLVVVPPTSPLLPEIPDQWRTALNSLSKLPFPHEISHDTGFSMPEALCFIDIGAKTHSYRRPSLQRYLQLRAPLLQRLTSSHQLSPINRPHRTSVWRSILSIKLSVVESINSVQGKLSKSAKHNWDAVQFINTCASMMGTTPSELLSSQPIFEGSEVTDTLLDDQEFLKRVTWEANELNVRLDFMALDAVFQSSLSSEDRRECVLDCICPPNTARLPLVVDTENTSMGLAAPLPSSRAAQLVAMRRLFTSWIIQPAPHFPTDMSVASPTEQELTLVSFYVKQFFNHFGRPPTSPRYLPQS